MIEQELWNHEETLLDGELLLFLALGWNVTSGLGGDVCRFRSTSLLLTQHSSVSRDKRVQRKSLNRDLFRGQDVQHVELVRHRALLANR